MREAVRSAVLAPIEEPPAYWPVLVLGTMFAGAVFLAVKKRRY